MRLYKNAPLALVIFLFLSHNDPFLNKIYLFGLTMFLSVAKFYHTEPPTSGIKSPRDFLNIKDY